MDERRHGRRLSIYNEPNRIHLSNKSVNLMPKTINFTKQYYIYLIYEKSNTHYTTFNSK